MPTPREACPSLLHPHPLIESTHRSKGRKMAKHRRGWIIAGVVFGLVALTVVIAASVAEEPLRRYAEDQANAALPGLHVTIGALALHPLTLSADLRDIAVRQNIHPEPPLVSIPVV
ncbi:MAG TPA: hypothetical protein VF019_02125, partial [Nitrospira sp.]